MNAFPDAARPAFAAETGGPVEFRVRRLAVLGDWAFGDVSLQRPGGQPIDWMVTKFAQDLRQDNVQPRLCLLPAQEVGRELVGRGNLRGSYRCRLGLVASEVQNSRGTIPAIGLDWGSSSNLMSARRSRSATKRSASGVGPLMQSKLSPSAGGSQASNDCRQKRRCADVTDAVAFDNLRRGEEFLLFWGVSRAFLRG